MNVTQLFEPSPAPRIHLPEGVRARDVARRARHAGLVFLSRAETFGRTKLRSWLILEYGMATEWTRVPHARPWLDPGLPTTDADVRRLAKDTRRAVVRMLLEASDAWGAPGFASQIIARGLVAEIVGADGGRGWAAVADTRMDLVDRVASLFIADYLVSASDYEVLGTCARCGELRLGEGLRHARCAEPPRESGVDLSQEARESTRIKVAG